MLGPYTRAYLNIKGGHGVGYTEGFNSLHRSCERFRLEQSGVLLNVYTQYLVFDLPREQVNNRAKGRGRAYMFRVRPRVRLVHIVVHVLCVTSGDV